MLTQSPWVAVILGACPLDESRMGCPKTTVMMRNIPNNYTRRERWLTPQWSAISDCIRLWNIHESSWIIMNLYESPIILYVPSSFLIVGCTKVPNPCACLVEFIVAKCATRTARYIPPCHLCFRLYEYERLLHNPIHHDLDRQGG